MLCTSFFSEDTFIFQGKDYIGALRSVSLKRDNIGPSPNWYLETVNDKAILKSTDSQYQYKLLSYLIGRSCK